MNRPRDSARDAIDFNPLRASSFQSGGGGSRRNKRFETSGNRFDRSERVVHLMTEDTNKPLPRAPLLLAERSTEVSQDEQLVRQSAFPKRAAANSPSSPSRPESSA